MSHPNSICKYQTPDLLDRSSCSLSIPSSIFPFLPVSQDRLLGIMLDFSLYFSYHMKSLSQTHFSSSQIHGEYFLFLLLPTLSTLDNLPSSLDFCSSPLPGLLLLHLPPSLCQHSSHVISFLCLKPSREFQLTWIKRATELYSSLASNLPHWPYFLLISSKLSCFVPAGLLTVLFPQPYWAIIDIKHCISFRCTIWWSGTQMY